MDPFALLEQEHDRLRRLFRLIHSGGGKRLEERVLDDIRRELTRHCRIDESILYPECERYPALEQLIGRFHKDTFRYMQLLSEIGGVQPGGENVQLNSVIKEVEAHLRQEEDELFPRARHELPRAVQENLAREIKEVMTVAGRLEPRAR